MLKMLKFQKYFSRIINFFDPILHPFFKKLLFGALLKTYPKDKLILSSVYGVILEANWYDSTFHMALLGTWGFYLHDILRNQTNKFAFLDIGANFGLYSSIAVQSQNCEFIVAIEPNPMVFNALRNNIVTNQENKAKRIKLYQFAVGPENKSSLLFYNSNNLGKANFRGKGDNTIKCKVRNYSLFDEINDLTSNLLIIVKIDVEGFEPQVLREIQRSRLKEKIQGIFIEISPSWVSVKDLKKMFTDLKEMGFKESWRSINKHQYDAFYIKSNLPDKI